MALNLNVEKSVCLREETIILPLEERLSPNIQIQIFYTDLLAFLIELAENKCWVVQSWEPRVSARFEFRFESLKNISVLILFVYNLMIGSSKNYRENYQRKCFWTLQKEPRLIANQPLNNWALIINQGIYPLVIILLILIIIPLDDAKILLGGNWC